MAPPRCLCSSELLQAKQARQPQQPHSLHEQERVIHFLAADITVVPDHVASMPQKSNLKKKSQAKFERKTTHSGSQKECIITSAHMVPFFDITPPNTTKLRGPVNPNYKKHHLPLWYLPMQILFTCPHFETSTNQAKTVHWM